MLKTSFDDKVLLRAFMVDLDIKPILKKSDMFSGLSEKELSAVAQLFHSVEYSAGDVIFNEGDLSDQLFVVYSGQVVIKQELGTGSRELSRLGSCDMFGEMALLVADGKRSASAVAVSDSSCLVLSREQFLGLIKKSAVLENQIERILIERISRSEQSANKTILQAYNSMLFSLSNLVESRDHETGGHLNRVQRYCKLLAEKLLENNQYTDIIDDLFIEDIYAVSPMHDIGKVAIPDAILKKPAKLTDDEFELMKEHPRIGANIFAQILEQIPFPTFEVGFNLTCYHHERFDGTGYPKGLAGHDIPLEARIMALADVFDALLSKRCYKPAFTIEQVISIIVEGKGNHFDPVLVDSLLENFDEFEAIHHEFMT